MKSIASASKNKGPQYYAETLFMAYILAAKDVSELINKIGSD
jgi:hypothetical protein